MKSATVSFVAILLAGATQVIACGGGKSTVFDAGVVDAKPRIDADDGFSTTAPTDMMCKTPTAPTGVWFNEISGDMGLGTTEAPLVQAAYIQSVDIDGDGFADIFGSMGQDTREVAPAGGGAVPKYHWLLMNRPDPGDSTGKHRIFVDNYAASGMGATYDGMGGRGFLLTFFGDLDNDGDIDVITCPGTSGTGAPDPCTALLNDGYGNFKLAANTGDLTKYKGDIEGGALLDYDGDGILDFWPGPRGDAPALFHGNGDGTFTNVTAAMGLPTVNGDPAANASFRQTLGVTVCDLNGDGFEDVLLSDYGREHNQVWFNNGGTGFTENAVALGLANDGLDDYTQNDESYLCFCQSCAAANNCPANYCAADVRAPDSGLCPDRGWVVGQSDADWRLGGVNFSWVCGDVDNDGDNDLYLTTIHHWDVGTDEDPTELIVNTTQAGSSTMSFMRPGNAVTGLTSHKRSVQYTGGDLGDQAAVMADIDNDGLKDIYLLSSDYPGDQAYLFHQVTGGTFADASAVSGAGQAEMHGVAVVDLDNDGDLDIIGGTSTARSVEPNAALRVYSNLVGQDSNWTQIKLVGMGTGHSNRDAVGAQVKVTSGGVTQMQEVQAGFGVSAVQNGFILNFGLGATCAIDSIEVRWPDGKSTTQTFNNVVPNYRIELHEGDTTIKYKVR